MTDLKSISPVRKLTVEEVMKVAIATSKEERQSKKLIDDIHADLITFRRFHKLLSRYESLTSRVLCKEMFVVGIEPTLDRIKNAGGDESAFEYEHEQWKSKLSQVWIKGFELNEDFALTTKGLRIHVTSWEGKWWGLQFYEYRRMSLDLHAPTVADLVEVIDRYNRTASTPIKLEWTENFIKEWVND